MPPAAPLAVALGVSLLTATIIIAVGTAIITAAITYGLQALLAPGVPSFAQRKRTSTIRLAVAFRKLHFGELITSGPLTFYESTNDNQFHHMIITLGDAPLAPWDSMDIVWLDDTPIFNEEIDGGGNVISGKFSGIVRIKKHLGGPSQTADSDLQADITRISSDFKGVGIAYVYVRIDWNQDKFPNGLPNVKVLARTNTVLDTRDSTRKYLTNNALILREYLTEAEAGLGYDAVDMDDAQTNTAANICDEIVTANPIGHAVVGVDVTNNEFDLAVFGTGAPVRLETGDRIEIFIASGGAVPSGLAVSTSYFAIVERLVGENYNEDNETTISLSSGDYSGDAATAITNGDVDNKHGDGIHAGLRFATTFVNAMARTAITITSAGTGQHVVIKTGEPRYAAVGEISSDLTPSVTISEILSGMTGRQVWTGGVFKIMPAAWLTPISTTFDEDDLWGPITVQTRHGRRERFNSVRGVLATHLAVGETTDYPPVIDSTFVTNDEGIKIWRDVDRPWTSRAATAQRLGKIDLARHRREIRVEYPTGPQGFKAIPGSIVKINNERRSWVNKTFEVLEQIDLVVESEGSGSPPLQGVTLSLAELDATVFDFVASSDETVKAPMFVPRGGNPFIASAPIDLVLTSGDSELFVKADGTIVSRIKVAWTVVDLFADKIEVQFKQSAASVYEPVGLVQIEQGLVLIWDVEDGVSYDIRVRTINNIGVLSDFLTGSHTVVGKTAAPPDVSTFNISRLPDGTRRFVWTATPPADVTSGGGFKLKFVGGTGGVWSGMTELHTGLLSSSPYETNELSAGTYTFGIKMVDSSGNESANAVIIEATIGDPRLRGVLLNRNEFDLGWPGTLVDCFVNFEGILESESSQAWSDLLSAWSSLPASWFTILNSKTPIIYTTLTMDLGSDVTFTPIVSVDPNASATVTMKVGTDSDGAPVGSFIALATVTMRYIQIKVSEASTDPHIQSIVTLIDVETQVEDYEDVDTSAATAGRFETIATGHFKLATRGSTSSITSATIRAFQNAGSGWTSDLLSKATTITGDSEPAIEFKIYKDGTLTDATVDVEIKGPKK